MIQLLYTTSPANSFLATANINDQTSHILGEQIAIDKEICEESETQAEAANKSK